MGKIKPHGKQQNEEKFNLMVLNQESKPKAEDDSAQTDHPSFPQSQHGFVVMSKYLFDHRQLGNNLFI